MSELPASWRISNADRDRATERLHTALDEGRITLPEFDERVTLVAAARTHADLAPALADLPGPAGPATVPEHLERHGTATTLRRRGRWLVPRRLSVISKAGAVRLDFTDAVIVHPEVQVDLAVSAASSVLVLVSDAS